MFAPIVLLLLTPLALGDRFLPSEGDVLVLNPDNFPHALEQFPSLLVKFYAPWCDYCKAFAPKFRNVARALAESDSVVKLAKIDATRFQQFSEHQEVNGYPTLMFYRNGIRTEYDGPLEEFALIHWLSGITRRHPRQVAPVLELTGGNFDSSIAENPFLMVQFYAPWCPHCQELAPTYDRMTERLAEKEPRIRLAKVDATRERTLAERNGAKRFPTLVFFRRGVPLVYTGPREQAAMIGWMVDQVKLMEQVEEVEEAVRFRGDDGQVVVVESTTKGDSEKIVPVVINLLVMIVASIVLI